MWAKWGRGQPRASKICDLAEGVGEVVVAADDVGYFHVVVVDDYGVQVGGGAVAAQDYHVVEFAVGDADFALDQVGDDGFALLGGAEADYGGYAGGGGGWVAVAPASVVAGGAAFGGGAVAHFAELVGAGVAAVGVAGFEEGVGDFGVSGGAGGLEDGGFVWGEV